MSDPAEQRRAWYRERVRPDETSMSVDEFLAWERQELERHALLQGEIVAMSGGSPRHSQLSARMIALLDRALSGTPRRVHSADLRLGLGDSQIVYADATVVCGPLALRSGTTDVLVNPAVVVEVLSKSTEPRDRGAKQAGYLALATLRHYVLVSQREPRVEVFSREPDGSFRFHVYGSGDRVALPQLGCEIPMDDLYAGAFELPGDEAEA